MTEHDTTPSKVPAPSWEATAAPERGLEDLPLEQVTVVLQTSGRRLGRMARWAEGLAADPHLSRCPVVVLHRGADELELTTALAALPQAQLVALTDVPEPGTEQILAGYDRFFDALSTSWFVLSGVPRRFERYALRLKARVARELSRVTEVGLTSDHAVLLYSPGAGRLTPRAYIRYALTRVDPAADPVMRDYLGFLAITCAHPELEGVDLHAEDREIELFARLSLGRFNSQQHPPWSYRFAVVSGAGGLVSVESPARLEQRVDNQGGRRYENAVGRLPLDGVPDGNHRLMIGVETAYPQLRSLRPMAPRAGVLAPARTVLLRGSGTDTTADETRYLMHTVGGRQSWILLQRGSGHEARHRWDRSMLRKDARAILKGGDGRRMRLARLVRLATRPWFRNRDIWLIGERADTAQDNGFHLFRHLREHHPERRVYYIIDQDSPQLARVEHLGNVVGHSTLRHQLLMMHATVLANAYSIKHMIPRSWSSTAYTRGLAWRVGAHRVYLKHGVHVSPTAVKRGTGGYDLYLAVNPREGAALRESSGYRDQIVETGMPRYDTLVPGPRTRTILFMPTWRRYLVPKLFGTQSEATVPFEGSTYQRFVEGLLTSPRLHEMLTRHDYRLQLLPHYNLRQELTDFRFTSDRTGLADTVENSFQDLIRGCDAFITDYSSVHFDVAYLGTPILYTHFDKEEYERGHAVVSWFDHEKDAFGPVTHTLEETLDRLEELLGRGCAPDPTYQGRVDAAFTFRDHHNSARVVEQVDALIATARAGR